MSIRKATLIGGLAVFAGLGCGDGDIINGFETFGSTALQGFVSRGDGSPVVGVNVFASFGPDAFGSQATTDARGLYELRADTHTPIDQAPFSQGMIECRLGVGQGLADTTVTVRFVEKGQTPVPMTVNFVVVAP
jgi:hypothetical protein